MLISTTYSTSRIYAPLHLMNMINKPIMVSRSLERQQPLLVKPIPLYRLEPRDIPKHLKRPLEKPPEPQPKPIIKKASSMAKSKVTLAKKVKLDPVFLKPAPKPSAKPAPKPALNPAPKPAKPSISGPSGSKKKTSAASSAKSIKNVRLSAKQPAGKPLVSGATLDVAYNGPLLSDPTLEVVKASKNGYLLFRRKK